MLKELKAKISELEKKMAEIRGYLDIDKKVQTVKDVEAEIAKSDFWTDSKRAEKLIDELKSAKAINEPYAAAEKKCKELRELLDIVEENDADTLNELAGDINSVEK